MKKRWRWWGWLGQLAKQLNGDDEEETLSYGVEGQLSTKKVMSLATVFAWWCHPLTSHREVQRRLLETRRSLMSLVEIADFQIYYSAAPSDELKSLIIERLKQQLNTLDDYRSLQRSWRHLRPGSLMEALVAVRLQALESLKK